MPLEVPATSVEVVPVDFEATAGDTTWQFSPEDRPDDPPLSEDDLLRQVTGGANADAPVSMASGICPVADSRTAQSCTGRQVGACP